MSNGKRAADILRERLQANGQHNDEPTRESRLAGHRPVAEPRRQRPPRQSILLATDMIDRVAESAVEALGRHPDIYRRHNRLVRLTTDGSLVELDHDTIAEPLAFVAAFFKMNSEGQQTSVQPSSLLLRLLSKRADYPGIREVVGITETPILRPDGSLVTSPGYDAVTRIIYRPRIEHPEIPSRPTFEEAQAAAGRLLDLIAEFDIVNDSCRASWLATLLAVIGRPAIDGPVPLTLIEASTAGSGKTLLADLIGLIVAGEPTPVCEYSEDSEELRKSLTAILREGPAIANLDNAVILGGASLDAVLTARTFSGRILGKSERTGALPVNTVFVATSNNPILRGDTHRRVIPCRLVPQVERPEERAGFKHVDLEGHVRRNRAGYVADALTIWRYHFTTREPAPELPHLGRFEAWTATVRTAVRRVTGHDPADSRSLLPAEVRGDNSLLARIFAGIADLPGGRGKPGLAARRILDLVDRCQSDELREAFMEWSKDGLTLPTNKQLGRRLMNARGRVAGGLQLYATEEPRAKTCLWYVSSPCVAGFAGFAGFVSTPSYAQETDNAFINGRNLTPQTPQTPHEEEGRSPF